jgi:hypothetical protein
MSVRVAIGIAAAILCTARPASAQVDFTGQWAPLYHEDTIERIPGPELHAFGVYFSITPEFKSQRPTPNAQLPPTPNGQKLPTPKVVPWE